MNSFSMTLQERHLDQIRSSLLREDGCEWPAYLLCSTAELSTDPWEGQLGHTKLLSTEVIDVDEAEVIKSTAQQITWKTQGLVHALKIADDAQTRKVVAVIHIHPNGPARFSEVDDGNEPDLWQLAYHRNGEGTILISLLLTGCGEVLGRVWVSRDKAVPLRIIRVVGKGTLKLHYPGRGLGVSPEAFDRQMRAFGPAFVHDLAQLRVGIVGLGGTGSPTAQLLARLGVGHIVLFDQDVVDATNLNRLHGAHMEDAIAGRLKVEVMKREIVAMGLGTNVEVLPYWISDARAHEALKSCDVIFGCTDDDDGRLLLNRLAYYYLTPVFDMGLAIVPKEDDSGEFRSLDARVTIVTPGATCLSCRKVVSPTRAYEQALKRNDPDEYERRKEEAYVQGEGNPSPAVITFTTECASMAVSEFLQMLHPYRECGSLYMMTQRQFHRAQDLHPGHRPEAGCPYCDSDVRWARGDVEPFLDRVG